jgi:pimeloyl-ACP methyl ester carboxylesterase
LDPEVDMTLIARTYWAGAPFHYRQRPVANVEPLLLKAADFREFSGLYYTPPGNARPRLAVVAMHPRVDFTRHYTFPRLLAAGIGCLGAQTRHPNNDLETVHEDIILDLGACVRFLKQHRGVERVVLIGNSGGGSLSAFFQAQARKPARERLELTPAGMPTRLQSAELIPADAIVYLSAHRGEGQVMNECIDPAVIDEHDPFASDSELDMYAAENGFAPPPGPSRYAPEFVARYRAAQLARVRRIDALAREHIGDVTRARELMEARGTGNLTLEKQRELERRRHFQKIMIIHRTMANLHYVDPQLEPSPREYGSLLSDRPDLMNMQLLGFGRLSTPHAWLSTWSGISSRANLLDNVREIEEPSLLVHAGRDREIYPESDAKPVFAAMASRDKTFVELPDARHYFEPDFGEKTAPQVELLMDRVVPWIEERFGS